MTDRIDGIWGLWADKDGRVRGNLRKGEQGVLIEEILPHAGRGDGFADFPLGDYIKVSMLWLATAQQHTQSRKLIREAGLKPGEKIEVPMDPLDLEAYDLLTDEGLLDYDRVKDLYGIIAILWNDGDVVQPVSGLLHPIWKTGDYSPVEIATQLMFTSRAENSTGLVQSKAFQFANILQSAYRAHQNIPLDQALSRAEGDQLLEKWTSATRKQPSLKSPDACHDDYSALGIIRHGEYDQAQIERVLRFILDPDSPRSFAQTYTFAKPFMDQENTVEQAKVKKALKSRKAERKRKKLGRKRR
ncbi:hypothetical protein [Halocynthiibacter sp.]|uniref:hypothetical protein n=1 Tax=Halocynthiibacter sp. TaxID=1979210 RepID=UPI003C58B504